MTDSLGAEDRALWARVTATIRALSGRPAGKAQSAKPELVVPTAARRASEPIPVATPRASKQAPMPGETLDGGWDRRLRQGTVAPDRSIDLHGHTLATAHAALDAALERAVAAEARLLLVVTGKPPRDRDGAGPRRGLIRAAIGDWLATSRHAGRIAAVRNAHPRHGGAGALYVVLRRRR